MTKDYREIFVDAAVEERGGETIVHSATFTREVPSHPWADGTPRYSFRVQSRTMAGRSLGTFITGDPDSVDREWEGRTGKALVWPV